MLFLYSFGTIGIILTVLCAVHAYRSGKGGWVYLIIFLGPIGSITYVLFELLPGLRFRGLQQTGEKALNTLQPARYATQLKEDFKLSPTLKTRHALAETYMSQQRFDEALALLEEGRSGIFTQDPKTLFLMAQIYGQQGYPDKALPLLETVRAEDASFRSEDVRLYQARMLADVGREDEAITLYKELAALNASEAPRYYLAELFIKRGETDAAHAVLDEANQEWRYASSLYKRQNQQWLRRLKQLLKSAST